MTIVDTLSRILSDSDEKVVEVVATVVIVAMS